MRTTTTVRSWPAIGLGLFFAAVTARVLLDDVAGGAPFTAAHLLSIAALVAALGAGHMAWPALREGAIVPGLLLVVTFLSATAYIVVQSGARNAERAGDRSAGIAETNRQRATILQQRAEAAYILADCPAGAAKTMQGIKCGLREAMAAECASGKGKRCDGASYSVRTYEAALEGYDAKLAALGPSKAPAAGYAHAARVLEAAGVPGKLSDIEARLVLLMPFATVLIAELATVAFLHLGLGHGNRQPANPDVSRETGGNRQLETASCRPSRPFPAGPRPPHRGNRRPVALAPVAGKAAAEADVIRLVARGDRLPSQDSLARRWQVHKGTVSKWLADFERRGVLRREWDGRHKQVAAA